MSRQTVFTCRDKVVAEGVEGLLRRKHSGGRRPVVRGKVREEFVERLSEGRFRSARDAQAFVRKQMSESGVRQMLRRLGGRLKVPRKSHAKKDQAEANAFKSALPAWAS